VVPELLPELLLPELDPLEVPELEPLLDPEDELVASSGPSSPAGVEGLLEDEPQPAPTAIARPRPSEAMNKALEFCIGKSPLLGRRGSYPSHRKRRGDFLKSVSICNVRERGHLYLISDKK
jgi:hypothetical protein